MKRVNFLCLVLLGLFFTACHSNDDTWGDWSRSFSFGGFPRTGAVTFTIDDVVYVGLGFNIQLDQQDKTLTDFWMYKDRIWTQIADFPGEGRYGAVAFVVDGKAYVGTGYRPDQNTTTEQYFNDFYCYDPSTNRWSDAPVTYLPDGAVARRDAVAFSLKGKGYVGTGIAKGAQVIKDMYCFDGTNWTSVGFPGDARCGASAFVIGNKAVICLGAGATSGNYRYDVLVYDGDLEDVNNPTRAWITDRHALVDKDGIGWDNDYNRIPRAYAVAFTSNRDGKMKGYIATGSGNYSNTCWEYDIERDRWDEVTELPSMMSRRSYAVGFSIDNYGYVTLGGASVGKVIDTDMWKFTPGIDEDDDNDYAAGD